jgi:hypothetical protein
LVFEVGRRKSEVGINEIHEEKKERIPPGVSTNSDFPLPNSDFKIGPQFRDILRDKTRRGNTKQQAY